MPIYLNILDSKKTVVDENGYEIIDLTESSMKDSDFYYTSSYRLTDEYSARPDIMNYMFNNSLSNFAETLKANRISNPFAIEAGEMVLAYDKADARSHFVSVGSNAKEIKAQIIAQYIDASKAPDAEKTQQEIDDYKSRTQLGLPPNILAEGETEVLIENGLIIYGPSVSVNSGKKTTDEKEKYLKKLVNDNQ